MEKIIKLVLSILRSLYHKKYFLISAKESKEIEEEIRQELKKNQADTPLETELLIIVQRSEDQAKKVGMPTAETRKQVLRPLTAVTQTIAREILSGKRLLSIHNYLISELYKSFESVASEISMDDVNPKFGVEGTYSAKDFSDKIVIANQGTPKLNDLLNKLLAPEVRYLKGQLSFHRWIFGTADWIS